MQESNLLHQKVVTIAEPSPAMPASRRWPLPAPGS